MFVSINMNDLQFVHKHKDHETVSALAWLEMPHKCVQIESTDREAFGSKMTALELRMLYRNTTALDITGTDHIVVREMLATLVEEKLLPSFAHINELQAQIALVEDDLYNGIPWKYALGSRRPTNNGLNMMTAQEIALALRSNCVSVFVGPSFDTSRRPVLDALEVYARALR